eukprot:949483_1
MSHDSHIWVELQCHYKNCNSHQWRTNSIRCIQGKAISHWCHSRQRRMALYTKGNKLTVVRCSTAAYQLFPARIKLLVDQSVVMDDPIQNENANGNQESMIEEYSSHNTNRIQTDQTNDLDDTQDASDHDDTNHNNQNRAARARTQITDNQLNDSQEQTNRIQSDHRARSSDMELIRETDAIDSIMDMNIDVEHGVADELDQKGMEPLTDRQLRQTSSFTMQRTTNDVQSESDNSSDRGTERRTRNKKRSFSEMDELTDTQEITVCIDNTLRKKARVNKFRYRPKMDEPLHEHTKFTIGMRNKLILSQAFIQDPNLAKQRNAINELASQTLLDHKKILTFGSDMRIDQGIPNPRGGLRGTKKTYNSKQIANTISGRDLENIPPTPELPDINFL